jgi:hypothetical protein
MQPFRGARIFFCRYSNNGSHFTGLKFQKMLKDHGALHFHAAISHLASVGLAERYVSMIIGNVRMINGNVRLQCLRAGSVDYWSHYVRNAVMKINTRCMRVYGFIPAELLLSFNSEVTRRVELPEGCDWIRPTFNPVDFFSIEAEKLEVYITHRDDKLVFLLDKRTTARNRLQNSRGGSSSFKKSKVGDLVLVRVIALSKQHGYKLEAWWSTPRIVGSVLASGVSTYVRELHHVSGKTKRYHVEDLLIYTPRGPDVTTQVTPMVRYARGAIGVQEAFVPGQQAFHRAV